MQALLRNNSRPCAQLQPRRVINAQCPVTSSACTRTATKRTLHTSQLSRLHNAFLSAALVALSRGCNTKSASRQFHTVSSTTSAQCLSVTNFAQRHFRCSGRNQFTDALAGRTFSQSAAVGAFWIFVRKRTRLRLSHSVQQEEKMKENRTQEPFRVMDLWTGNRVTAPCDSNSNSRAHVIS